MNKGIRLDPPGGEEYIPFKFTREKNNKRYELSNHLGNVLAVVSDQKEGIPSVATNWFADYYDAKVVSANDYYPFGMAMPGRTSNSPDYRYGFNGKEKDESGEWGELTHYDYGFRIYNPGIGRFLSVDPLTQSYPMLTPYQFASNRPVDGIDLDGLEYLDADDARLLSFNVIPIAQENYVEIERSVNLNLGPALSFSNVPMINVGGKNYYDVGQHLYYNNGIWSDNGTRQQQTTEATKVGIVLISNIQGLPTAPADYTSPPTFTEPLESYDVANEYIDCGGMCFAVTMARVNEAYEGTPLALRPTRARNQDYNISGSINVPTIPADYLGYGVGGALARTGNGNLVDNDGVWSGELQTGAPIQYWNDTTEAEAIESLTNGTASGHSFIFSQYTYDANGTINGFEAYDYNGSRTFQRDANNNRVFLGANLEE